jgi:Ca2+-binding EF-hand superfamily protein
MPPKAAPKAKAKAGAKKEEQAGEIIQCFQKMDSNKDGIITHDELAKVLRALDPKAWTDKKVEALLKDMDKDGDGKINVDDFVTYIMSSHPTDKKNRKNVLDAAAKIEVKAEEVEGPEGTDGKEALAHVLDKLFEQYDIDKDGQIERIEFLEGEEKRLGGLDFGPKPRREAMAWFKEIGAEGTPVNGMFVSREKWNAGILKLAVDAVGADEKKQADWIFENRLKAILEAILAEEEAKKPKDDGKPAAAPIDPAKEPTYPMKIGFKELADRITEARAWNKSVLILSNELDQPETFLSYQNYGVVDAKQLINEVFVKKSKSMNDARADVEAKLKQCMNSSGFCKPVHVRLSNSAFDIVKLCEDGVVPQDVFNCEAWTPSLALEKGYIDEGHKFNVEVDDNKKWKDFHVVISSTFTLESGKEHLTDKIPFFDKLAVLDIDPDSIEKGP